MREVLSVKFKITRWANIRWLYLPTNERDKPKSKIGWSPLHAALKLIIWLTTTSNEKCDEKVKSFC